MKQKTKILTQTCTCLAMSMAAAHALPDNGIEVISNSLNKIIPYLSYAFTVGGAVYGGLNIRKVVLGDYRAVIPGAIAMLAASTGISGIFGANVLTVTLP